MERFDIVNRFGFLAGCLCISFAAPAAAVTQEPLSPGLELPSQPLDEALRFLSLHFKRDIIFATDEVAGIDAPAVSGSYSIEEAIGRLLERTGLRADIRADVILVRTRNDRRPLDDATIVVTGTRMRGVPVASPIISITQQEMLNAGRSNLGDIVRLIPQNFGGGQNPGVGLSTPVASGENLGSGSAINLRGLGQDATLTLLNGHRLPNGGNRQSVDVSSIPIAAIDRIEVIADGASAIYGSDAVAGVANIILKPGFEGLSSSLFLGGSTDGGNAQQRYNLVTGSAWQRGGAILAYEFGRTTRVDARQRSYTAEANPGLTLLPFMKRHNALASANHELAPGLTGAVDGLYSIREDNRRYLVAATASSPRYSVDTKVRSWSVAPSLEWQADGDWKVTAAGTYGRDRTKYRQNVTTAGQTSVALEGCYCNDGWSAELKADGSLFTLPAGAVRTAFGGGYRRNNFNAFRSVGAAQDIDAAQGAYFLFGEAGIPLIGPAQEHPLAHRLDVSVAARHETYPGVDSLTTPKIGIVYQPIAGIALKGSWGRSFKAPTLFQQYSDQLALLNLASTRGASGLPSDATVLLIGGGKPDLKAERARSWSAALELRPAAVPGFSIEISYFHIDYRDRVVLPLQFAAQALSNAAYAPLVTRDPSDADKAAALAGRPFFNLTNVPFDLTKVVAIIDTRYRNVASQQVDGIDAAVRYTFQPATASSLALAANLSYLRSKQQLSALEPTVMLSGTYFNPPHFRGSATVDWSRGPLGIWAGVHHIGGVEDNRFPDRPRVTSMTMIDISARYSVATGSGPEDIDLSLSVQNIFNAKPDQARSRSVTDPAYDSTNYSPVGRFIALSATKRL